MEKKIQMPYSFVINVFRLVILLEDTDTDAYVKSLCGALSAQIEEKLAAMDRRRTFTAYKTASQDSNERETYRREYLDKACIHKDWRTNTETTV